MNPTVESDNFNSEDLANLSNGFVKNSETILYNYFQFIGEQSNFESKKRIDTDREQLIEKTFTPDQIFDDPRFNHLIDIHMETIKEVLTKTASYNLIQKSYFKDVKKPFVKEVPTLSSQELSIIMEFVQQAKERMIVLLTEESKNGHLNKKIFEIYEVINHYYNLKSKNWDSNGEFNNFKSKMYDLFCVAFPCLDRFRFRKDIVIEEDCTSVDKLIQKNCYKHVADLLKISRTVNIPKNPITLNNHVDPRNKNPVVLEQEFVLLNWTIHPKSSCCSFKKLCTVCEDQQKKRRNSDQTNNIELIPLKVKHKIDYTLKHIPDYKHTNNTNLVCENVTEEAFEKQFEKNLTREKCLYELNNQIKLHMPCKMIRVDFVDEQDYLNKEDSIIQETGK